MPHVISKASLDHYQNALGLNRRANWTLPQDGQRVYQIDKCIDPTADIVSAISTHLWAAYPELAIKHAGPHRFTVDKFYDDVCKIRLVHFGDERTPIKQVGGYVVLNGELLGMHSLHRGIGNWLLDHAINDGAVRLSCFDVPQLIKLYTSRGFVEKSRELNTTKGLPDVVWLELKK